MTTYRLEATRQAWRLGVGWLGCDTPYRGLRLLRMGAWIQIIAGEAAMRHGGRQAFVWNSNSMGMNVEINPNQNQLMICYLLCSAFLTSILYFYANREGFVSCYAMGRRIHEVCEIT
jgi:hypothetical protein